MITDLKITQSPSGTFDLSLSESGDFETVNSLDSSILYAIYGERRASDSEVPISQYRRGWIGNEGEDFENGSKLWLFEQSRITLTVLSDISKVANESLDYLVVDGFCNKVQTNAFLENQIVKLRIQIFISPSEVETRVFELWKNTGI